MLVSLPNVLEELQLNCNIITDTGADLLTNTII